VDGSVTLGGISRVAFGEQQRQFFRQAVADILDLLRDQVRILELLDGSASDGQQRRRMQQSEVSTKVSFQVNGLESESKASEVAGVISDAAKLPEDDPNSLARFLKARGLSEVTKVTDATIEVVVLQVEVQPAETAPLLIIVIGECPCTNHSHAGWQLLPMCWGC
jgi:hypothetical protein